VPDTQDSTDEFESQSDDSRVQEYVQPSDAGSVSVSDSDSDSDSEFDKEIKQPKRMKRG
jgi:hypothetical protein